MILVVDDDPAQRRMTLAMLKGAGREAVAAESGPDALARLKGAAGAEIALVLLDLAMPGMDGMETLARLRPLRPDLPVIVLTANGSVSNAVAAMKAGAEDFLIKPVSPERLEVSVRNALRLRSLSAELRRLKTEAGANGFDGLISLKKSLFEVVED